MFPSCRAFWAFALVLGMSVWTFASPSLQAQSAVVTSLTTFQPSPNGANPNSPLLQGTDGSFYGTTYYGGTYNMGIVFKVALNGTETILHSFSGISGSVSDGSNPNAGLIQGSDGNFYGTAYYGGPSGLRGNGAIFKIAPDGTETVLHFFNAGEGANPTASLVQGSDGNFYGTASVGGANLLNNGTVFKMTPDGTVTVLHSFTGGTADGAIPNASLVQGTDGNFYGTTTNGGAQGEGIVFKITPGGTEMVLYSFAGGTDGANPVAALLPGSDGNFYGTTSAGGARGYGTVFKITPGGTETVLYSFTGGTDGSNPSGALFQGSDGNFYGTTANGGVSGCGGVFKITSAGALTALYAFSGIPDGSHSTAGLLRGSDGGLYGTTQDGGAYDEGAIFRITSTGTERILCSFGGSGGNVPYGGLIQGPDGNFYGTAAGGGANGHGTVFKMTPEGTEIVLHSFTGPPFDGAVPYGSLLLASNGNFYGTTHEGGAHNLGTVYKISPGGRETVLYSFAGGSDGTSPSAGLVQGSDGNFYGTTQGGGASGKGTVFKITPAGVETVLHTFLGNAHGEKDGDTPYANLIQGADGNFYGTTQGGGAIVKNGVYYNSGTVYKITPAGAVIILYSFAGYPTDGAGPWGPVVQGADGNFYGTTFQAGANGYGTVFKVTPAGTETVLYAFTGNQDGAYPGAGLTQGPDGNFYGTTYSRGAANWGTIFRVTPGGTFTLLHGFTGNMDGGGSISNLTRGADGNFYGTTVFGGTGLGVVFRLALAPSDFNDDGYSDLLFQHQSTSQLAVWYMNGLSPANGALVTPTQATGWKAVGDADFNSDNKPDILFQNVSTGQLAVWYMNGLTANGGQLLSSTPPAGWSVVSIADFNGDGYPDLLLQNRSAGQLAVWYMQGTMVTGAAYVSPSLPSGWIVAGSGDFNQDGHPDILLQSPSTGQLAVWYMNNNIAAGGAYITPVQQAGWRCVGVIDLNGDGWPDLIFQNQSSGQLAYWLMNGVKAVDGNLFSRQPPAGWQVVAPH